MFKLFTFTFYLKFPFYTHLKMVRFPFYPYSHISIFLCGILICLAISTSFFFFNFFFHVLSYQSLFINLHTSKNFIFVIELGKLNNLEQLYLEGSSIDKSFLHKIGVVTSLNVLTMSSCELKGTLPTQGRGFSFFFFSTMISLRIIRIVSLKKNNYNSRT